jgi:four helix bundle protein
MLVHSVLPNAECVLGSADFPMSVNNYKDLIAWQRAMDLVEKVYLLTQRFPKDELYGLTSQIRRAVVSVPSNIAEGEGRNSKNEFLRFLSIAHGSLREVETQLLMNYLTAADVEETQRLCDETGRILNGLMNSLRKE